MSIRQGLLALLNEAPSYGYQLKVDFEQRTGGTWPLNIGQVYSTLSRLERDGLVVAEENDDESRQQRWLITNKGRAELQLWFSTPVRREDRHRDELAIKLAIAVTTENNIDIRDMIQMQRTDTIRVLQHYTRLKKDESQDFAWLLVLDGLIFQIEAEIRWLDHCENRLLKHKPSQVPKPIPADSATSARSKSGMKK